MQVKTKYHGVLDIDRKSVYNFDEGLPGFEDLKRYTVLKEDQEELSFKWLQSIDRAEIAFAIINPFLIKKDYEFYLEDSAIRNLGIEKPEDVHVYSIVVVPEDVTKISMNLKAPVVINQKTNKGMQVILDTDEYGVRHYILEELQKWEVMGNACAVKKERPVYYNK
jgi:flagellar assembly factor FliW